MDKSLLLAVGGGCSVAVCHERQQTNNDNVVWQGHKLNRQISSNSTAAASSTSVDNKWTSSITSLLVSSNVPTMHVLPSSSSITECSSSLSQQHKSSIQSASDDLSKFVRSCRDSLNNSIGFDLLKGGMDAEAISHFELAPDHVPAIYNRAMCYAFGRGTRKNMKKVRILYA